MVIIMTMLFFTWPTTDLCKVVYESGPDIGPLAPPPSQFYGGDDFRWVSPRPLYSGELEGLPLYEIFHTDLTDLAGFEFRHPYYQDPPSVLPDCGCTTPRSVHWNGYSIPLSEEQKFLYDISKGVN